jgi:hypothetical protein
VGPCLLWGDCNFMIIWTGVSFSILFHPFREEIVYSSHNETDDRADRVNSARISEMDRLIESISMWYSSMGLRCSHFSLLNRPTVTFNSNRSVLLCYTSRAKSTVSLNLAQKCVQSVDTINGQPHVCSIIQYVISAAINVQILILYTRAPLNMQGPW